jgi:hypothetical protein
MDYDATKPPASRMNGAGVQAAVAGHGGVRDLVIGDKGSYTYVAFGAPVAHENDLQRSLNAALELRALGYKLPFISGVQIGISRGTMRTGAYGGATRRTYGVLGDDVNLAARLMQAAAPGQIMVSGRAQYAAGRDFIFEARPPLPVKGKAQPAAVFLLHKAVALKTYRLPDFLRPADGRPPGRAGADRRKWPCRPGAGQVLGITAECRHGQEPPGGRAIHLAQRRGFTGYGVLPIRRRQHRLPGLAPSGAAFRRG